jgi:hypothetical protein
MGIYFNTQFNQLYYAFLLRYLVLHRYRVNVRVMVFNATFNNISVISWRSVLLVKASVASGENHRIDKLYHIMLYMTDPIFCKIVSISPLEVN